MPIANDPLGRCWIELGGANPQLVAVYRPALFALLAFAPGREPMFVGTAFVIAGDGEAAILFTAKHLITGIAAIQYPYARSAPSSLFVPTRQTVPTTDPARLKAIWMNNQSGNIMDVDWMCYNDSTDLGLMIVKQQSEHANTFAPTAILIDATTISIGDRIHIVSHDSMTVTEVTPPRDAQGDRQRIRGMKRVSIRLGYVTGIYPKGYRQYRWPCFTTSIPVEPGMSGGLATIPRDGETIAACGVVCADASVPDARTDQRVCGESVIGMTWPGLALRIPDSIPSTPQTATKSLYEAMSVGSLTAPWGGPAAVPVSGGRSR